MSEINKRSKQQWFDLYKALQVENQNLCTRYNETKCELQTIKDDRDAFAKEAQDLRAEVGKLDRALMRTEAARAQLEHMMMEVLK